MHPYRSINASRLKIKRLVTERHCADGKSLEVPDFVFKVNAATSVALSTRCAQV
jgi:hypothetical protein